MATAAVTEQIETTAEEFPSSMAVAIRTQSMELASPAEIQRAMMQLDEQHFLAEIMGEALEKWFYGFKIGGKNVEGVSAAGAHEFARLRAEQGFPIRFPMEGVRYEEAIENGEPGIRAFVVARDYRSGMEAIGVAFYPHFEERKIRNPEGEVIDTERVFDRMAGRKAMSVAERNAILRLIPEKTIISALKVRAQIVGQNEQRRQEESKLAFGTRPEAKRVTAGEQSTDVGDPYRDGNTTQPNKDPEQRACPKCSGGMWDNRDSKRNPNAPDFKCKDRGCDGALWPGKY